MGGPVFTAVEEAGCADWGHKETGYLELFSGFFSEYFGRCRTEKNKLRVGISGYGQRTQLREVWS